MRIQSQIYILEKNRLGGYLLRMIVLCHGLIHGLNNGLALTPPRGWRSWDAFENSATQALQQKMVDALIDRTRRVDGSLKSLADLNYSRIGLDDSWQDCGAGVNGTFHSAAAVPLVKNTTFPSLKAMNDYARSRGIRSGWYLNSCDCCERGRLPADWAPQMRGDVAAIRDLGFDGIKLDSCGPSQDLRQWSARLNASGGTREFIFHNIV